MLIRDIKLVIKLKLILKSQVSIVSYFCHLQNEALKLNCMQTIKGIGSNPVQSVSHDLKL